MSVGVGIWQAFYWCTPTNIFIIQPQPQTFGEIGGHVFDELGKYPKSYLGIVPKGMAQDAGLTLCDKIYVWISCPQLKALGRYKNRWSMKLTGQLHTLAFWLTFFN